MRKLKTYEIHLVAKVNGVIKIQATSKIDAEEECNQSLAGMVCDQNVAWDDIDSWEITSIRVAGQEEISKK